MTLGIPKKLGHIWIGPLPAPTKWMDTWKEHHPDWEYTLYGNDFLNTYDFKTRPLIDEYLKRQQYAGAADLMRLEILYDFGGLMPGADSICYHNTDELFTNKNAYTVYENEFVRGKLVSPIYACEPGNTFVKLLIDEISRVSPNDLDEPWISTGNLFVARMIEKYSPANLTIFPSHYFIPVHYTGVFYEGNDKVYAKQLFGSTQHLYAKKPKKPSRIHLIARQKYKKQQKARELIERNNHLQKVINFELDYRNNHLKNKEKK